VEREKHRVCAQTDQGRKAKKKKNKAKDRRAYRGKRVKREREKGEKGTEGEGGIKRYIRKISKGYYKEGSDAAMKSAARVPLKSRVYGEKRKRNS